MGNFNRKKRSNKSAVSEIIGNILILGITVTLFSSIMYFVVSMPAPHQTGYADMQPQTVTYGADYRTAYLNITNKGGQPLDDSSTGIYIFVNDTINQSLKIHDGGMPIGSQWTTGKTWNYILHFTPPQNATKARISISIIDTAKNVEIYNGILTGGNILGNSPPVIGARGTSPSPNYPQTIFFADVTDPDGDLNTSSVYLDASSLGAGFSQPIKMTDSNNDGRFTCGPYTADPNTWNGRMVIVSAKDKKNNNDTEAMTINIQMSGGGGGNQYIGPFNNYSSYFINGTYPPDANGGESGGQTGTSGTTFYYIRELANPTVITRDFTGGDGVLIEIWSDSLRNLAIENSFYLIDPLTGDHITPPTSINAFGYGGIFGTFHKYTLNFTAPTNKMIYPFTIRLRDNVGTVVSISDYINVNRATYPMLQTYKLNPDTLLLEKCGTFNHTDTVYLKIITKDTDSSIIDVLTGDIEVADYTGRYIIKKLPPAANVFPATPEYSAPLSSLFKTSAGAGSPNRIADTASSGVYTIEIVLRDAYQGWWLPRTNAYTITLSEIADVGNPGTAEDYNSLIIQLNVTAPLSTTDIVASVGSGSYTWSSSGASWSQNSLVWFKGGERSDQWTKTVIDANTKNGPVGLALTDVDGDSYKDLIVGWQDQSVSVGWYKNLKVDGSEWSTVPYIIAPAFDAYPGIDRAGGTDRGTANEDVTVYARNSAFDSTLVFKGDYYSPNEIAGALSTGDFDGYGDQEVVVSFVHPVVYSTATSEGSANYANSFGMFFNRGIYVYWNIIQGGSSVTKTSLAGTLSYLSGSGDNGANGNNNPAAMDIQCADLNKDGYDDIVAVYQDGKTLAWLNQFSKLTGNTTYRMQNAFGPGSLISNIVTVPGRAPWDDPSGQNGRVAKVRLMDMNKDGYPDIVRTSTVGQGAGGADANIYVLYTKQSTNSNPQFPIVESHTYGSAIGSFADLAVVDNLFENITETTSTVPDTGNAALASLNSADANPANPTTSAPYFTSGVYQVAKNGGTLAVNGFTLNSANSGNTVASASLNMKYIVWPLPVTSTTNPGGETHSYGTATGSTSNLVSVNGIYEDLHEQTLTTGTVVGYPTNIVPPDNTGEVTINDIKYDDTAYYDVQRAGVTPLHNRMQLSFSIDPSQSGKAVNSALLAIKYYTGTSYPTSGDYIEWSTDGSNYYTSAALRINGNYDATNNQYTGTFDLKAAGVDTYAELNSLQIRFINTQSGTNRMVSFNVLVEQVTFVNGNVLDWTWTINNNAAYTNHDLTINAYCQNVVTEGFSVYYSSDNLNWGTALGLITSTTAQDYSWPLANQLGSTYYVRIVDNEQGVGDATPSTFRVDMVKIVHSGEAGYAGTNTVEVSFDTGSTWISTGVLPSASDTSWVTTSVNLVTLKGSQVTYNDLVGLRVRFINNDANPSLVRSVWFDVLNEQVLFNDGERADWTWTINNDVTYANHNLTVNAFCLDSSESFTIEYSIDNVNWLGQRTISSTTAQNYTWNLPAHSGNYYYVRIVDDDKNTTDKIPSTLCLNMIKLLHYPAEVNWPISDEKIVTITGIGSGEFITAIALGDIGKSYDDFKADTYPDIVVSTSKVGNGDATHTLFVIMQGGGGSGFEAPTAVDTSVVATRVGNNNAIYDTKAIELGDFNGDKNLDIVMVIGFAPGRTGSGVPSLYIYANRPDLGAATFQESAVNALDTSQSAINVKTGNIDLAILLPFLGVVGVIAGEAFVERRKRKK